MKIVRATALTAASITAATATAYLGLAVTLVRRIATTRE